MLLRAKVRARAKKTINFGKNLFTLRYNENQDATAVKTSIYSIQLLILK